MTIDNTTIFELVRTAELFNDESMKYFMNRFSYKAGISQILTLSELREGGPQKQAQLAKKLGYTPGAMTGIADRLTKQGLARRKKDESDRRINLLELTEKGQQLLLDAQEEGQLIRKSLYASLSEEEITQLLAIQKKLLATVQGFKKNTNSE